MEDANVPISLNTQWSQVSSVVEQPLWSLAMQKKLRSLQELPENWNSYGSRTIAPAAVAISLTLLGNLKRLNMGEPEVVPVPGGGIQLEWENDRCELEIEIRPNKHVEYLIVDESGGMLEGRIFQPEDAAQLGCLTNWFIEQKESVGDLLKVHAPTNR